MPRPQSAVSEKINNYLTKLGTLNIDEQKLEEIKTYLQIVSQKADAFYIRDPQTGKYPPFTKKRQEEFMAAYRMAAESLGKIMAIKRNDPVLKEIAESLSTDISVISQAEIGPNSTLPRIIDYGQVQEVDISNATLGRAGANLSSRIPMTITNENGEEIQGFFTPETKYDPMKLFDDAIDLHFKPDNPCYDQMQQFKRLFREYAYANPIKEKDEHGFEFEINEKDIDPEHFNYYEQLLLQLKDRTPSGGVFVMSFHALANELFVKAGLPKLPPIDNIKPGYTAKDAQGWNEFEQQLGFLVANEMKRINTNYGMYQKELLLDLGDNIDKRNAAMSTVAGLLNVPNLIVKSKTMVVVNNGVKTTGTFLPSAEGKDLTRMDPKDTDLSGDFHNDYNYSNGFKDIADLQILDYICGNVDRHVGNMLYKFDENGKFSGVQGIDNDASFGSNVIDLNEGENQIPPFEQFAFISASMAKQVLNMTPEFLRVSLASHGLAESELNAAVSRLKDLQTGIRESQRHYERKEGINPQKDPNFKYEHNLDPGYPRIIPDDAFESINFVDGLLSDTLIQNRNGATSFSRLVAPQKFCQDVRKMRNDPKAKAPSKLDLPTVRQFKLSDAVGMGNQKDIYYAKLKELNKYDKSYIRSSPEFRNMKTALQALSNLTTKYAGKELDQEGYDRMKEQLDNLSTYNQDYIDMKSKQTGRSKYAESRLNFAIQFKDFIAEKKLELEQRIKGEVEIREERRTDSKSIIKDLKEELKAGQMNPQLAGKAIKAANDASKLAPVHSKENIECRKIITEAMKYLKAEPDRMEQSDLTKKDLISAKNTVIKGLQAEGKSKEKAMESPEVQSIGVGH